MAVYVYRSLAWAWLYLYSLCAADAAERKKVPTQEVPS